MTRTTHHHGGRKRFWIALFALLMLGVGSWAVTGCGGDDDDNGGSATANSSGSEKLSGKVLRRVLVIVGGAALAGFAVFELSMRWEESLVVGRSGEGLLASSL